MNQRDKIQIKFGVPKHGWLHTIFQYEDYKLELDISDVPLDPMLQLCNSLIQLNKGINHPDRVIWHLEPYCYYLQLEKLETEYKVIILESDGFGGSAKVVKEISGTFENIILPLYRGLKLFWVGAFTPPHWNELESERIKELTELINEQKKSYK